MNKKISIGIGLTPLVTCKRNVRVGEKVNLNFIFDISYKEVILSSKEGEVVQTNIDGSITFSTPGIYNIIISGRAQHQLYSVHVLE